MSFAEELLQQRKILVDSYKIQQSDLTKQQRNYKKILGRKYTTRIQEINKKSALVDIQRLKNEKADLKAQIYVATGRSQLLVNNERLRQIKCHVACQEHLHADIKSLKWHILSLEKQIKAVEKRITILYTYIHTERRHLEHVSKCQRREANLANQITVLSERINKFQTSNSALRAQVIQLVTFREFFFGLYNKIITQLEAGNRYLIDLIEHASVNFDNCTHIYERINAIHKKKDHDVELRKIEMLAEARKTAQDTENFEFYIEKDKPRGLADLEPREYRRREAFKKNFERKSRLYDELLDKILNHSGTRRLDNVITNFQHQESLYYSFYTASIEKNYRVATLNSRLQHLYDKIEGFKGENTSAADQQNQMIKDLENELEEQIKTNLDFGRQMARCDGLLNEYFKEIHETFIRCNVDRRPLENILGDYSEINVLNFKQFLKLLEARINQILARVYITQKKDPRTKQSQYIVRSLIKRVDIISSLEDIVLSQQCPECSEGEAVNKSTEEAVIESLEEIRKQLHEKVMQPEMQYLLHSLSECRLERSRMLTLRRSKN